MAVVPPPPPTELSPSALVYFFADRVVEHGGVGRGGTHVACRPEPVKVKTKGLAALQLAIALWNLRERRLIGLELFEKRKRIGGPVPRVRPTLLQHVESETLEGMILDRLREEPSIEEVRAIYGNTEMGDGPARLVAACQGEATALGYGAVDGFWRERWSGDCAKIAGLEPRFEDLWRRWERFQAAEPALAAQLIDDCVHGLPYRDA
jgi:hypothetical protein